MKILISCSYFSPHIGGLEMVVQRQAESLVAAGHQVTVLTCLHDAALPADEQSPGGYRILRRRSFDVTERFGAPFPVISPRSVLRLAREVNNYDVVHVHDMFYLSSHAAALSAVLRNKPLYFTQHVAVVQHPSWAVTAAQQLIYQSIGRYLFSHAQRIVVYNTNVHAFLRSLGLPEEKILHTTNGIDVEYFAPPSAEEKLELRRRYQLPIDRKIVLFVGRLVPKKGFDIVFEARSPDYLTIIAGNGTVPSQMLGERDVLIFGAATQAQVRDLYRLSDLFVFPAAGEIFTLAMQEAMACGLPVVAAEDDGYAEYDIRRDLIGFVPRRADAVRTRIEAILADPGQYQAMSEYGRRLTVTRFSWQHNYATELAIYDARPGEVLPTERSPA